MSEKNKNSTPNVPKFKFNMYWVYGAIFVVLIGVSFINDASFSTKKISTNKFFKILESNDVSKVIIINKNIAEVYIKKEVETKEKYKQQATSPLSRKGSPLFQYDFGDLQNFENKLNQYRVSKNLDFDVDSDSRGSFFESIIGFLPFILLIAIWIFFMKRMSGGAGSGGGGGQIFNIGKSKAKLFDKDTKVKTTFENVAGLEGAKEEVQEIVDFLKNPGKYTALGGKIPKGALLVGPPGTGKTLLAKAVAGEAEVPFFSLSGSDFVEMFVGVGASRVRDLFKQAAQKSPSIIFIDEIDAIGRARGKNSMTGGNDERENTLNQLLTEMDGFGTDVNVIVLAATNRADVLDSALMRAGRFDRQIYVDLPDIKERKEIFEVHIKPLKLSDDVKIKFLAQQTPGFSGADIANMCNEAALIAARKGKESVEMIDFQDAIDRVIGGLEKKNKIIAPHEKSIIAYHEAGHAVCGWFLEHAYPLLKVTIVPRGTAALGYAQYTPTEQYLYNTDQLMDQICMTLGGRAAEEIFFGKISTGASNDLQQITRIAYSMVTAYGMNSKVGNVSYYDPSQENTFTKPYSEETGKIIDHEVRGIIEDAYQRTLQLLRDKKEAVEILAKELLAKEVLHKSDVETLIGKRPFEEKKIVEVEVVEDQKPTEESN